MRPHQILPQAPFFREGLENTENSAEPDNHTNGA